MSSSNTCQKTSPAKTGPKSPRLQKSGLTQGKLELKFLPRAKQSMQMKSSNPVGHFNHPISGEILLLNSFRITNDINRKIARVSFGFMTRRGRGLSKT